MYTGTFFASAILNGDKVSSLDPQRDAAQMDMTEFFDFNNVPWATPPPTPAQATGGACNAEVLQ